MTKKSIAVLVLVFFFSGCRLAFASLTLNEVLYSPSSKQWVEVYNDTGSGIDLTQYKILDAGASKNGHGISPAVSGGSTILPAHQYGVIALDPSSVSATYLFHASLGIKPTADSVDTVILHDLSGTIPDNSVSVPMNSAINGNSLQLINGSWIGAPPTPGLANDVTVSSIDNSGSGGGLPANNINGSVSAVTTATKNKPTETPKIKTEIIAKTFGFAGQGMSLRATTFGYDGEKLYTGKYFWNFGDGDSKEIKLADSEQPLFHSYFYPGEYLVSLFYYQNYYSDIPDATSQMNLKIIPADITISRVGEAGDFFVELSNNTDYNADISNWILASDQKSFMLPRNTMLQAKKKMMLSPRITNFSINDQATLQLKNKEGETVFDLSDVGRPNTNTSIVRQDLTTKKTITTNLSPEKIIVQTASVADANISPEIYSSSSSSNFIFISFVIFIGLSAGVVYFIRRKKFMPQAGGDFEILDE